MSDVIAEIIDLVIEHEGGFVHHEHDRGGATRFGITEATARRNRYFGPMDQLDVSRARAIYRAEYVEAPGFDEIVKIDRRVGEELVDTGVLMGPGTATMLLQRGLNVFNAQASLYSDLKVDGGCGPLTRAALQGYIQARGRAGIGVLVFAQNATQCNRLMEIAEADPTQESFCFGQIAQRCARAYL